MLIDLGNVIPNPGRRRHSPAERLDVQLKKIIQSGDFAEYWATIKANGGKLSPERHRFAKTLKAWGYQGF
jgi:hypothetical protein